MIRHSILIGVISGIVLGGFLWAIEKLLNIKVYTLLMNVDFIPFFEGKTLPPVVEWFFHLLIAWLAAYFFIFLRTKLPHRHHIFLALCISLVTAISYFPLTLLAIKETPAIDHLTAITFWFLGHLFYGIVLYLCGKNYTISN